VAGGQKRGTFRSHQTSAAIQTPNKQRPSDIFRENRSHARDSTYIQVSRQTISYTATEKPIMQALK